ncbi:MAG TPA: PhoH family protein, partial [Spirochaetota bacterium]|nr:PhoH family protein [Spirochaetota bacterium]
MDDIHSLVIENDKILLEICGVNDKHLRKIEHISSCKIFSQGNEIYFSGLNFIVVEKMLRNLIDISKNGGNIYNNLIEVLYKELERDINIDIKEILSSNIEIQKVHKVFNPRTVNQGLFIQILKEKDIVFAYGPAGTGKTFIAIAYAMNELINKKVKKVILTRPIVEAGESLGFLPGDFTQKINPYLVPLFDAINFIVTPEVFSK